MFLHVQAQLDALPPARFLIDTGDEAALRLYSPFVAQYGLDKKYPHGALTIGGGIGGVSRSRVTRIGSFTVAGVTFRSHSRRLFAGPQRRGVSGQCRLARLFAPVPLCGHL